MLELKNIKKQYLTGDTAVHALRGVSLCFRRSEFVSVLGPSGCGKTTLLNIVGGLDCYSEGDLIINGRSTKDFKPYDWDAYRNACIGFVFQNYNLIPHLTVLGNVELALTLSGESKSVRRRKAEKALEEVGLKEQLRKKPNQLSGGQMQRVAIARALVNDPEIILADEPTGALDSKTSIQIVDLLKEISKNRLVVMVTHNDALAKEYSTRIIRLHDGSVLNDSHPYDPGAEEKTELFDQKNCDENATEKNPESSTPAPPARTDAKAQKAFLQAQRKREKEQRKAQKKEMQRTSMSFWTALGLSGRNLASKKGRTSIVSFAGSIGIIGIALVLSISNGFTRYIEKMQTDTLAGFPIAITPRAVDIANLSASIGGNKAKSKEFPTDGRVEIYSRELSGVINFNDINDKYIEYVKSLASTGWTNAIDFANTVKMNVIAKKEGETPSYTLFSSASAQGGLNSATPWTELVSDENFIASQYDVLAGKMPKATDELALVIDKYNRIGATTIESLGMDFSKDADGKIGLEEILRQAPSFKVIANDAFYPEGNSVDLRTPQQIRDLYETSSHSISLRLTGILRVKESVPLELYGTGIVHTKALTAAVIDANKNSAIVQKQFEQITLPYGEGIDFRNKNKKFYESAGLDSDQIALWKQTENTLRTFLTSNYPELTDETVNELLKRAVDDPTLSFITDTSAQTQEFKQRFAPAAQIVSTFTKMISVTQNAALEAFGAAEKPTAIYIYPKNFETKKQINRYLDDYNRQNPNAKIMYTDASAILADTMGSMVNIISYVLVAFAAVSLVVSSIMIAIITYVSVIERTKEIGVLRSIGARKKDISRVFNAETVLIGFIAGTFGVLTSFLLTFPVNWIINAVVAANGASAMISTDLAVLNPLHGLLLIAVSVVLTLVSGLIPSAIAARKDPVVALRSE